MDGSSTQPSPTRLSRVHISAITGLLLLIASVLYSDMQFLESTKSLRPQQKLRSSHDFYHEEALLSCRSFRNEETIGKEKSKETDFFGIKDSQDRPNPLIFPFVKTIHYPSYNASFLGSAGTGYSADASNAGTNMVLQNTFQVRIGTIAYRENDAIIEERIYTETIVDLITIVEAFCIAQGGALSHIDDGDADYNADSSGFGLINITVTPPSQLLEVVGSNEKSITALLTQHMFNRDLYHLSLLDREAGDISNSSTNSSKSRVRRSSVGGVIKVFATTRHGLANALSTIQQLVGLPNTSNAYGRNGDYTSNSAPPTSSSTSTSSSSSSSSSSATPHLSLSLPLPLSVTDWAESTWRGLMLDVSRHFMPVPLLLRCIDAMAVSKYNTLHLHLTDSQSFPLLLYDVNLDILPDITSNMMSGNKSKQRQQQQQLLPLSQLALRGTFATEKIYSLNDMKLVVAYAARRGIEIIPEIDVPAHVLSWAGAGAGLGASVGLGTDTNTASDSIFSPLVVHCDDVARKQQTPHNIYPLDPSLPLTYIVVAEVLKQVAEVFPSKYLHIGGDEVDVSCWKSDAHIMEWWNKLKSSSNINSDSNSTDKSKSNINSAFSSSSSSATLMRDMLAYFEQQVFDIVYALDKVPIVWQGVQDSGSMPPASTTKPSIATAPQGVSARRGLKSNRAPKPIHGSSDANIKKSRLLETATTAIGHVGKSALKYSYTSQSRLPRRLNVNILADIYAAASTTKAISTGRVASKDEVVLAAATLEARRMLIAGKEVGKQTKRQHGTSENEREKKAKERRRAIVQPWKCWGGLATRAATQAAQSDHPVVMSACWYLDYDTDWTSFLTTDMAAPAKQQYHQQQQTKNKNEEWADVEEEDDIIFIAGRDEDEWSSSASSTLSVPSSSSSSRTGQSSGNSDSADTRWYLGNATASGNGTAIAQAQQQQWHRNYFVGGEGAMWTEHVDHTSLGCRMWPRAGAIAARLWGLPALLTAYESSNSSSNSSSSIGSDGSDFPSSVNKSLRGTRAAGSSSSSPTTTTTSLLLSDWQLRIVLASYARYRFHLQRLNVAPAHLRVHYAVSAVTGVSGAAPPRLSPAVAAGLKKTSTSGLNNTSSSPSGIETSGRSVISRRLAIASESIIYTNTTGTSSINVSLSAKTAAKDTQLLPESTTIRSGYSSSSSSTINPHALKVLQRVEPSSLCANGAPCGASSKRSDGSGSYYKAFSGFVSEEVRSERDLLQRIAAVRSPEDMTEMTQTGNYKFTRYDSSSSVLAGKYLAGEHNLRLTGQCIGFPESIQRPLTVSRVRVAQLNVADGSTGKRGQDMLNWLQQHAQSGTVLVGFCELNGWQNMESTTDLMKNREVMVMRAGNAGYVHSHIFATGSGQPFNLGVASALPFTVVQEHGPPVFQRGVVHIFVNSIQLHVFIVHLHAHSVANRVAECKALTALLSPLLKEGAKVVVMGDFNTLSPLDAKQHDTEGLVQLLTRTNHTVFTRLREKFLKLVLQRSSNSGSTQGLNSSGGSSSSSSSAERHAIGYEPMQILLDAGMVDSCIELCHSKTELGRQQKRGCDFHDKKKNSKNRNLRSDSGSPLPFKGDNPKTSPWTLDGSDAMSKCVRDHCPYTEPTQYNPEWPISDTPHPRIRLDYILVSPAIVCGSMEAEKELQNYVHTSTLSHSTHHNHHNHHHHQQQQQQQQTIEWMEAGTDISNATHTISDHYPVYASWLQWDDVNRKAVRNVPLY